MKRTHARLLSALLCLALLLTVLPVAAFAEGECAEHSYANGFCTLCDSTEPATLTEGVYQIGNAGQLYWFAQQVNAGAHDLRAMLTEDITVNPQVLTVDGLLSGDGSDLRVWTPIGADETLYFGGTFDGNGKTVSGLYFDDTTVSYVGLFGYVDGGEIGDLCILDSYLRGGDYVGAVVGGSDYTKISNCTTAATVVGGSNVGGVVGNSFVGTIADCVNSGIVNGSSYVGGIVGTGVGYTLERCGNSGIVLATGSRVGGVAGSTGGNSTIHSCYNIAEVSGNDYVGGILGNEGTDSTLTGSYDTGTVSGDGSHVGVLVGGITGDDATVEGCFYLTDLTEDEVEGAEALTAETFASGELTYYLNGSTDKGDLVWFQTLGIDPSPLFTGETVYLATIPCPTYSNSSEVGVKEHTGVGATCTDSAICDDCGAEYAPALGHDYDAVVTDPTCDTEGYTTHTCTVCGDSYTDTPVPATGHTWEDATCTTAKTCTVCGHVDGEALGHAYESQIQEPTCTRDGHATHTCTVCGDTYTELLSSPGHIWEEANCVAPKTCTVCGETEGEISGHNYKSVVTDPTCTKDGYTTHTCAGCGDSYTDTPTSATGHNWKAATCTTPKTCAVCGKTEGEVLGHDYDKAVVAPTCNEAGYTTYTCADCGHTYNGDYTDALGHSYVTSEVAPTCTDAGYTAHICSACGHSYNDNYTNALGHAYKDGICANCGAVALAKPTIVSCFSRLQTSVKVTWTTVENADGYELWRSSTPDNYGSWILAKTIKSGDTDRYTNQGLTPGVTYYYSVRAFITLEDGSRVYSDYSDMDYMPAAVVFDSPYSNSTFRIRLRWNEIDGAHGYQIWRKNADGTFSVAKTIGDRGNQLTNDQGATTAYSNVGLTAGEDYTYKMRAFYITEDGRKIFGAYSDEVTIAVMPETPEITVTSPKTGRVSLAWEALNGTEGFQVWMSTSPDSGFAIGKSVTDGTATGATVYGLESGKTYYFKVRAYVEVNGKKTFGAYSEVISITVE